MPFPIHDIHPDNDSEFFNHHMLRFWGNHPQVELSRSSPYSKNGNRFVEQKNSSLVRAYVGDMRLNTVTQAQALEYIYNKLWLLNNCFQPSLRLSSKQTIPADDHHPARIHRKYSAQTPWQRICATEALDHDVQDMLQLRINLTNPRLLWRQIYADLDTLYLLHVKTSNIPENVFETLADSKSLS